MSKEYTASSIQIVNQRTHLLKRMSLTFGHETGDAENPFSSQKTVAIREIIDNAVDEVEIAGGNHVRVGFYKDGSVEVQDDGRGLPTDSAPDSTGKLASGLYLTMGIIQSGGKFTTDSSRYSGGLNGVGGASTFALAARADIEVYRNNKIYKLSFKDGVPGFFAKERDPQSKFTPLEDLSYLEVSKDNRPAAEKKKFKTGTLIRVWLDETSFGSKYPINRLDIMDRVRGTAFLIPNLNVEYYNEVDLQEDLDGNKVPYHEVFNFENGVKQLVELNQTKDQLNEVIQIKTQAEYVENVGVLQADGVNVKYEDVDRVALFDIAFSWENGYDYNIESYVNNIRTRLGGVHEDAFEKALTRAFNTKIRSMRGLLPAGMPDPIVDDYTEGLSVVISAKISEPQFTGQSKERLGGREVQRAMLKALEVELDNWAQASKNFEAMKVIGKKVSDATKARLAQREERDLKRQKAALETSRDLPEKLVDCEITHTDNSELYIAEGDSAKGALKAARHAQYQAILPIRGKIINTNKATTKAILANKEVQDIIKCIDAGVGDTFDTEKMRYGRIFIAADADPDGGAIASLIVMLFWELFRPVIEEGRLYQLQTPLFVVKLKGAKGERIYVQDDIELRKVLKKLDADGKRYDITRIKGLGEADKHVLNETGMNPNTRIVKRITVKDAEAAQRALNVALGRDVEPRKEWIEANPFDLEEAF